jgi:hypothetical protein
VTFHRTAAQTAREGQKRASGEVARRGAGFIEFLVGFAYTPPLTLSIIKTDDSRVRNVSDLYPGGSCPFRCQTGSQHSSHLCQGALSLSFTFLSPMLDDCTSVAEDLLPKEMAAIGRSEAFASCEGEPDKFGWVRAKHRGLTLTFSQERAKLKVQGSLATFAKGHNLHLLTHSELQLTIPALAAAVGLPATRLRVVGLELALDLDGTTSPQPLLETLKHHKGSRFLPIKQRKGVARPMEFIASHADYSMKMYNKGLWEAQHGNYLPAGQHRARFEVVMTRARPIDALLNRSETTLADLVTPEFYAAAVAHLEQKWKEVVREQPLTFAGLNGKQRRLLGAGGNPEYWRGIKRDKSIMTFKRERKEYKELIEYSASRMPPDKYEQQFSASLAALLAPVAAAQNDTFLHTFSPVEISPLRIERAAPAPSLVNDASGLPASWPCLPADDGEREPTTTAARCCQTCGRALTSSSGRAKFCSEREWGAAAKKCRNADSNPRNNAAATLRKIKSRGPGLFDDSDFIRVPEQIRAFVLAAAA